MRRPTLARKFKQFTEAGVVMLGGTDSGIPMKFHSSSTWRELDAWVNLLGVDPIGAIRGATYWPSVAMRVDKQVGTVSPGKYADVIAIGGTSCDTSRFSSAWTSSSSAAFGTASVQTTLQVRRARSARR
jgi:imidazolonepropionase-like amidohydrolase